jgi:hypothetical protein
MTVCPVYKPWLMRAALVLFVTGLVDGVTVWFTQRPVLWATLIASSLPISITAIVIIPMLRQESRKSH